MVLVRQLYKEHKSANALPCSWYGDYKSLHNRYRYSKVVIIHVVEQISNFCGTSKPDAIVFSVEDRCDA